MGTTLNPYLSFRDTAAQAMDFYQSVFGGEVTTMTFAQMPGSDPAEQDKVMHSQLQTDNGLTLMAADVPAGMDLAAGSNFSVSLSGGDDTELRGYWDKLSEGGAVTLPLAQAPWGDTFGMCTDRFGTPWMVNIVGTE